jgi:hypothetical protein
MERIESADIEDDGNEWPVEWDGDDYWPLPESWLDHERAYDRDQCAGPQLLATSVALRTGTTIRVRYLHPTAPQVLVCQTAAVTREDGVGPAALENGSEWPRSLRPGLSDPVDTPALCEREHLRELWSDRVDAVPADDDTYTDTQEVSV